MISRKMMAMLLIVMLLVATLVTGCSGKNEDVAAQEGQGSKNASDAKPDTLRVAIQADITGLDPVAINDTLSQTVTINVFSRLFKYDQELNIIPDLAEKWEYLSDTEFQVKIKEGVKFHDGTEVKAEDVKCSLERAKASPKVQHILAKVDTVKVIDDYTVVVVTKAPFAPLRDNLVHASNSIVPKKYVDESGKLTEIIGSGPYKYVSRKADENVILEINNEYFDDTGKPSIANIEIKIIPEGTSRTIGLETGEIDLVTVLETIDFDRVKDNPDLQVVDMVANNINYLAMNTQKPPFDNKLVRQAFNYAIDKEAVLEVAANGIGQTIDSFTPSNILGYVKNTTYKYDLEKAKALLKESEYVQGDDELVIMTSGEEKGRMAQVVQGSLQELGLNVSIEQLEWSTYLETTSEGKHQMCVMSWSTAPEPDRFFPLLKKEYIYNKNKSGYDNPEVDELLRIGAETLVPEEREVIYNKVHTIGMEDAPWVPFYSKALVMGATSKLDCSKALNPKGEVYFNQIKY